MLKITKFSVTILTALAIIGCGASGSNTKTTSDISSYSDAEKLAYAIANQKKALNTGQSKEKKSRAFIPCADGGKISYEDIEFPADYSEYLPTEPTTMVFQNCKDGYSVTNGSIKINLDKNENGTIQYLSDFSFKDNYDEVFIKKGGRVEIYQENGWEVATINMVAVFNGITHGGENLIYKSKKLTDGRYIEYPVSGKEKIGDSVYFTVDPNYDASKTPFTSNQNDELISGLFKYLDDQDHAIELEITAKDVVTVRVDEDGDGTFSENEKSSIKL